MHGVPGRLLGRNGHVCLVSRGTRSPDARNQRHRRRLPLSARLLPSPISGQCWPGDSTSALPDRQSPARGPAGRVQQRPRDPGMAPRHRNGRLDSLHPTVLQPRTSGSPTCATSRARRLLGEFGGEHASSGAPLTGKPTRPLSHRLVALNVSSLAAQFARSTAGVSRHAKGQRKPALGSFRRAKSPSNHAPRSGR
jgi:hypothetical protein